MEDDRMELYHKITEEIFSKPPAERRRYLKEIKQRDLKYYERIEHLIRYLTSHEGELEEYAQDQIKRILDELRDDDS